MAGSYNPNNNAGNNFNQAPENKGFLNKFLRSLSNFDMEYEDMVIRNQVGIGINEDPNSQKTDSMYDFFSSRAVAQILNKKSIPYLDKAYTDKQRILREYSIKDEIRNYIATVADDCIIFNGQDFCSPKPLATNYSTEIRNKYQQYFEKIYNRYGFSDGISAWTLMKDFLIDGYVAMEIVWDDKKQNIISFNRLKPQTLVPSAEATVGRLWIQYPEDAQLRRIFLDSQLIFISYTSQHDFSETSYVEGLIKPYNQLKILEQTRIIFNITNASPYQKFTIPTKGLSMQKAKEQIGQLIADYSEHVDWDDTLGTLTINGSKHLPYNKQVWFPEGDMGTPNMELVTPQGTDLNEETTLKYFSNALKRASKIPFPRFEHEQGGGPIFTMDSGDVSQEEQQFANFIGRLRANFKEIITKPLKLQMCMEFPELKEDENFLNSVDIIFSNNQTVEEWKRIKTFAKKVESGKAMLELTRPDQTPYFHIDFIVNKILKLTAEEIQENNSYWIKSRASGEAIAPSEGGGSFGGGFESGGGLGGTTGGEQTPEFDFGGEGGAQGGAQGGTEGGEENSGEGGAQGEFDF